MHKYLAAIGTECAAIPPLMAKFDATLKAERKKFEAITDATLAMDLLVELTEATTAFAADSAALVADLAKFAKKIDTTT